MKKLIQIMTGLSLILGVTASSSFAERMRDIEPKRTKKESQASGFELGKAMASLAKASCQTTMNIWTVLATRAHVEAQRNSNPVYAQAYDRGYEVGSTLPSTVDCKKVPAGRNSVRGDIRN